MVKAKTIAKSGKKKENMVKKTSDPKNKGDKTVAKKDVDSKIQKFKKHGKEGKTPKLMGIYESLRKKNTPKETKFSLVDQVLKLCLENPDQILHKHDTVRVLESCVKFGSPSQRKDLFQLLCKNFGGVITSKYAKFFIQSFMDHGSSEQKKVIIESMYGKLKTYLKNKVAATVVNNVYERYASVDQRAFLVEEFYGPQVQLWKKISERSVQDILENDVEKRVAATKYMMESLRSLYDRDIMSPIVHRVLLNLISIASDTQKLEVISWIKDNTKNILHTIDGSKVAMNCIWLSSAKERKTIIKSYKTYVVKICKEEYGHLVLLALFDSLDDTVLVNKVIVSEILQNISDLIPHPYGRKVILYLLNPRSSSFFTPQMITLLKEGDGNTNSKKEKSIRERELQGAVLPGLTNVLADNLDNVIQDKSTAVILLAALETSIKLGEHNILLENVADLLAQANQKTSKAENLVHGECVHWVLKSIIIQDKQRMEKGLNLFSTLLCDKLLKGAFSNWASSNRGCFVLVSLMENDLENVSKRIRTELRDLKAETPSKGFDVLKKLLSK